MDHNIRAIPPEPKLNLGMFSHYRWLEDKLMEFFKNVEVKNETMGIVGAHGDKFYGYRKRFHEAGIDFCHGVALGMLTYTVEYGSECRETANGWVAPVDWIVNNCARFSDKLPSVDRTNPDYYMGVSESNAET